MQFGKIMLTPFILITLGSCLRKPNLNSADSPRQGSFVFSGKSDIPLPSGNQDKESNAGDLGIQVGEANWLFADALKFMDHADGNEYTAKDFFGGDSKAMISRATFVDALSQLEQTQRGAYLQVVRDQYVDATVINLPKAGKLEAEYLIRRGFLAPTGPMVVGRRGPSGPTFENVTLNDAGDAVGYLISRWAQQTHQTSLKWSPDLQYQGH